MLSIKNFLALDQRTQHTPRNTRRRPACACRRCPGVACTLHNGRSGQGRCWREAAGRAFPARGFRGRASWPLVPAPDCAVDVGPGAALIGNFLLIKNIWLSVAFRIYAGNAAPCITVYLWVLRLQCGRFSAKWARQRREFWQFLFLFHGIPQRKASTHHGVRAAVQVMAVFMASSPA